MIDFLDNREVNTLLVLLAEAEDEAEAKGNDLIGEGHDPQSDRVQRQFTKAREFRNMITKIGNAEEGIVTTPEMLS